MKEGPRPQTSEKKGQFSIKQFFPRVSDNRSASKALQPETSSSKSKKQGKQEMNEEQNSRSLTKSGNGKSKASVPLGDSSNFLLKFDHNSKTSSSNNSEDGSRYTASFGGKAGYNLGSVSAPKHIRSKPKAKQNVIDSEEEEEQLDRDLLGSSEHSNYSQDMQKEKEQVKTIPRAKTTGGKRGENPKKSRITPLKHQNTSTIQEDLGEQEEGGIKAYQGNINDDLPYFVLPENKKDAEGRRPDDPHYDPTTILIPSSFYDNQTRAMQQYWDFKRDNYDKVLLFKLGKFYQIFFQDAIICNKTLELRWMSGAKKLHVGFPEKVLDKYLEILVQHGHKVVVVEQLETPRQMERRIKTQGTSSIKCKGGKKVITRGITNIYSRGTFVGSQSQSQYNESKHTVAIVEMKEIVGLVVFDIATLEVSLGQFKWDSEEIKTMLLLLKPVEILMDKFKKVERADFMKMLRSLPDTPFLNVFEGWGESRVVNEFDEYFGPKWPGALKLVKENREDNEQLLHSLGLLAKFMEQMRLTDSTIKLSKFKTYDKNILMTSHLVLDAAALQSLEVLHTGSQLGVKESQFSSNRGSQESEQGSLFYFINYTRTPYGRRLLRKWICAPLRDIEAIQARLNAVQALLENEPQMQKVSELLGAIKDIEQKTVRAYQYSVKQKVSAVYFQEIERKRLQDLHDIIVLYRKLPKMFKYVADNFSQSERLTYLASNVSEGGKVPIQYEILIDGFDQFIEWREKPGDKGKDEKYPVPTPGVHGAYDEARVIIEGIQQEFKDYLDEVKVLLGCQSIDYVHSKYRYEIEIPESRISKMPKDFQFTSSRKGFKRFRSKKVIDLLDKMEIAEEKERDTLKPFVVSIFSKFHQEREVWNKIIEILAEFDSLISLAKLVQQNSHHFKFTRPQFVEGDSPLLEIRDMYHPCVATSGFTKSFVPNDTILGTQNVPPFLIVTGPNMGGKSTLLRQTCIAVILAQMGSYVPAGSVRLTLFDRIFTRLGANDKILEGKSTFFVEMEECKALISHGTDKSLAILDELGRGTATYDGFAIASGVVKYIVEKIKCLCLFSTHYHMLADQYTSHPLVGFYHMAVEVEESKEGTQGISEDAIRFLYKFIEGRAPSSFGLNVARLAGLSKRVIRKAAEEAQKYREQLKEIKL